MLDFAIAPRIGGKYRLAEWITSQFPPHKVYVEAFGGMANVLMRKPRSPVEIVIEKDFKTWNLLRVIQKDHKGLIETVSGWQLEDVFELWDKEFTLSTVEEASLYWVTQHLNRGAYNRNTKAFQARAFGDIGTKLQKLHKAAERLKGVAILRGDALALLPLWPDALVYADPPYLPSTRLDRCIYNHELCEEGHARLLAIARKHRGHFVLSGYPSQLYNLRLDGWRRLKRSRQVSGIYSTGRQTREVTECLWLNFSA